MRGKNDEGAMATSSKMVACIEENSQRRAEGSDTIDILDQEKRV